MNVKNIISMYKESKEFETELNYLPSKVISIKDDRSHRLVIESDGGEVQIDRFNQSGMYRIYFRYFNDRGIITRVFNQLFMIFLGLQEFWVINWVTEGYELLTFTHRHQVRSGNTLIATLDNNEILMGYHFEQDKPYFSPQSIKRHPICLSCPYYAKSEYLWCTISPLGYKEPGCDPSESTSELRFLV